MANTSEKYVLLMPVGDIGGHAPGFVDGAESWAVSIARPAPGSTTQRIHSDIVVHRHEPTSRDGDALNAAVVDLFTRMREQGLPGVLDAADVRQFCETPLDFCCRLTEVISDDLPDIEAEDFCDDDFENHPFAALRETMVDACPEFSGLDASDPSL